MSKKSIRADFRNAVFERDKYQCVKCGKKPDVDELDAHHITDRNEMPNGGYVKENGISLCKDCHWKAEQFHRTGKAAEGFSPSDLYDAIGSSISLAMEQAKALSE